MRILFIKILFVFIILLFLNGCTTTMPKEKKLSYNLKKISGTTGLAIGGTIGYFIGSKYDNAEDIIAFSTYGGITGGIIGYFLGNEIEKLIASGFNFNIELPKKIEKKSDNESKNKNKTTDEIKKNILRYYNH